MDFALVVAFTKEFGIGNQGNLAWHPRRLHFDMAFLKHVTTHSYTVVDGNRVQFSEDVKMNNVVIMGRKTWESIPPKFRPMENRINIIITSNSESIGLNHEHVYVVGSFEDAIDLGRRVSHDGQLFVLGGSSVYHKALNHPDCAHVFATTLTDHPSLPCDTFFPIEPLSSNYDPVNNITEQCYEILKSILPKSSSLTVTTASITEKDITYKILFYLRCRR